MNIKIKLASVIRACAFNNSKYNYAKYKRLGYMHIHSRTCMYIVVCMYIVADDRYSRIRITGLFDWTCHVRRYIFLSASVS